MKWINLFKYSDTRQLVCMIIGTGVLLIAVIIMSLGGMDGPPVQLFYQSPQSSLNVDKLKALRRSINCEKLKWETIPFLHKNIRFLEPLEGDRPIERLCIFSSTSGRLLHDSKVSKKLMPIKAETDDNVPWWKQIFN